MIVVILICYMSSNVISVMSKKSVGSYLTPSLMLLLLIKGKKLRSNRMKKCGKIE